jgi:hypothetical protein
VDLASLHLRLWRLHLTVDLEIEQPEREEPAPPMGFGSSIDVPDLEDGEDLEDRRLGFVLPP